MKKTELKKALKPLIKECIKEVIFEQGILSGIISEVVQGLGANTQPIVENTTAPVRAQDIVEASHKEGPSPINENKKRLLDAIGRDAYGGVDIFENTDPLASKGEVGGQSKPASPLSGIEPNDPGIDIDKIPGMSSWSNFL